MPRIELINVSKRWGNFIGVNHLNMVIEDHEFITLLGPSGCGKTTLLSILCGLEDKSSGEILYSKDELRMGYMLQNDTLFPTKELMFLLQKEILVSYSKTMLYGHI